MTGPVLLVAIALAEAATASVAPRDPHWRGLVVVLVPPIDDDVTRNALARVSGELAAAPFRTITKTFDPDRDVMAQVETAGSDQSATAAFALVRDREPGSSRVTIWVSNRDQRDDDHAAHAGRGRRRRPGGRAPGGRDRRAGAREPGGAVACAGRGNAAADVEKPAPPPRPATRGSRWRSGSA